MANKAHNNASAFEKVKLALLSSFIYHCIGLMISLTVNESIMCHIKLLPGKQDHHTNNLCNKCVNHPAI